MTLKEIILRKYASIDEFIEATNVPISRTYLYRLVNDTTVNPSLTVIEILATILGMEMTELAAIIYSNRYRD